jgi:hypothetical protein
MAGQHTHVAFNARQHHVLDIFRHQHTFRAHKFELEVDRHLLPLSQSRIVWLSRTDAIKGASANST